ncbi:hypothetical protein N7G274_010163 [Stereocaulon virgatum]|uniref:Uncharacterized protein n=1 Tax=Stereocaulon virgatum TaxID=373712 RepID=A0ABR3ZWC6_9LECA
MAEILALVSGAVTVAQLAGQVGVSVLKLKALWSEVNDVPDTVNALMMHLELLDPILSEMGNEFPRVQGIVQTDRLAMLSLEQSRQALQNLERLVNELHQQISSKKSLRRGIVKVKVTLKKDLIRTYQEQLQSALQLLTLSQQNHLIALSRVQTSILVSEFQTRRTTERIDHPTSEDSSPSNRDCRDSSVNQNDTPQTENLGFKLKTLPWRNSSLSWKFTSQMANISVSPDETIQIYRARLHLPLWLLPKAWDLQVCKSYSGWKITLKPWSTRSYTSEVFRHALEGSKKDLLRVLKSNEASLYDRNPEGWTLLHYAAFKGQLEVFQALLEFGLSVQETDNSGVTPLYHLCRCQDDLGKALDIYRYLSSQAALDEVVQDLFLPKYRASKKSSLYRFIWRNSELLDFIVTQFHPAFYRLPASHRFKSISWVYVDPKLLLKVLTHNEVVSATLFLAQIHGSVHSSLHEFARLYFQKCLNSLDTNGSVTNNHGFEEWRELLRWMFVGVSSEDICRKRHEPWEYVTPLLAALLGCDPTLPETPTELQYTCRRLSAAIKAWLEDLLQAGVDLEAYGAQEWSLYRQDGWLQAWRWNNLTFDYEDSALNAEGPLLVTLTYGPRPEDWTFQWDFTTEEFATDSWETLDSSQSENSTSMPGGWVYD